MNKIKYLQSFHQRRALLLSSAAIPALAWARALRAQQQGKVWRVGFLAQRTRRESLDADMYGAFVRGMRELGYVEGRNLVIEWRYADGKVERLPELAAELTRLNVDAIARPRHSATRWKPMRAGRIRADWLLYA